MAYDIETKCLHLENKGTTCDKSGAISFPIYQTATFAHLRLGNSTGYDYSRLQNPTREQVEKIVANLEGGIEAVGFSSGMSAIAAVMELFHPGDHLIVDDDLYGGSVRLFLNITTKNGIEITRVNLCKENIESYVKENTKAVFIETPTNPMMNIIDIKKLSEVAKKKNLLLIVDNTFLSPYFQNPLKLSADIVVHSGTKYLGGHNDTLAGFVVSGSKEIAEKIRFIIKTTGAGLAPFDSWLILRGIKTLAIRMEKAQENAIRLAEWLIERPEVVKVIYPGLTNHPGHQIIKKQARGFGAMLTFEVASKELVEQILKKINLIQFAESLGGVETLITYPITQTHADVPPESLAKNGITDRILRLSVGIENIEALTEISTHGIFGYSEATEEYIVALKNWMIRRHDWAVSEKWLVQTPGIVFALAMAVKAYTKENEAVLIQQPVYYPFSEVIKDNNRKLVISELQQGADGKYYMDYEDFENKIVTEDVKLFFLCNPHNPVGRVWTKEELLKIGDICLKHNVLVVSDEIHADFAFKHAHTVFTKAREEYENISIVCTSPSKTFNIAGLQVSNIFIANQELRRKFCKQINASGYSQLNLAGLVACEVAYQHGDTWLDAVLQYIKKSADYVEKFLNERLPRVKMTELEGTYLVWLDFRAYGLSDSELNQRIIHDAGLWLDRGSMFGKAGEGFQRINIACARSVLKKALEQLASAFEDIAKSYNKL